MVETVLSSETHVPREQLVDSESTNCSSLQAFYCPLKHLPIMPWELTNAAHTANL